MQVINTHTRGFKIKVIKDFSKKDFIQLCELVSQELNILHNLENEDRIIIKPEPISEGGMRFYGGIYNSETHYKTIRLPLQHPYFEKWPWITSETYNEWKTSDEILWKKNSQISTCLKSFYEAPSWSIEEVKIFKKGFEFMDLKCTCMPTKKSLIENH